MFVSFRSRVKKEQYFPFVNIDVRKPLKWYDEFTKVLIPYPATKMAATFTAKTHWPKISSKVEVK